MDDATKAIIKTGITAYLSAVILMSLFMDTHNNSSHFNREKTCAWNPRTPIKLIWQASIYPIWKPACILSEPFGVSD